MSGYGAGYGRGNVLGQIRAALASGQESGSFSGLTTTGNVDAARFRAGADSDAAPGFTWQADTTKGLSSSNGAGRFSLVSTSAKVLNVDNGACRPQVVFEPAAGVNMEGNLFVLNGFIQLSQIATPAAPAAGLVRIFNADNGASKSQTRALFDSGVAQIMNTEP